MNMVVFCICHWMSRFNRWFYGVVRITHSWCGYFCCLTSPAVVSVVVAVAVVVVDAVAVALDCGQSKSDVLSSLFADCFSRKHNNKHKIAFAPLFLLISFGKNNSYTATFFFFSTILLQWLHGLSLLIQTLKSFCTLTAGKRAIRIVRRTKKLTDCEWNEKKNPRNCPCFGRNICATPQLHKQKNSLLCATKRGHFRYDV